MTQPPSLAPETALRSSWRSSPARKHLQTPSNKATSVLQAPCFELIQLEQSATVGTTYMQEHGVAAIPVDLQFPSGYENVLEWDMNNGCRIRWIDQNTLTCRLWRSELYSMWHVLHVTNCTYSPSPSQGCWENYPACCCIAPGTWVLGLLGQQHSWWN